MMMMMIMVMMINTVVVRDAAVLRASMLMLLMRWLLLLLRIRNQIGEERKWREIGSVASAYAATQHEIIKRRVRRRRRVQKERVDERGRLIAM